MAIKLYGTKELRQLQRKYINEDGTKKRGNIASIETAKRVIDTMVRYGYWPDIEMIG